MDTKKTKNNSENIIRKRKYKGINKRRDTLIKKVYKLGVFNIGDQGYYSRVV